METKICKSCNENKKLCEFNKDKYASDGLRYRCRECTSKEYKKYYYENREIEISRQVNYQNNNKTSINSYRRMVHKKKYNEDVLYKLKVNMRNRIKLFLKSKNFDIKLNGTYKIVGCTPELLKEHIEKKFTEGMTWENYSLTGWNIDHIIPLSSAKSQKDVIKLCHYTNLQPLWSEENFKKGNKIYENN